MGLYITPDEVMVGRQIMGQWHGDRLDCLAENCRWSTHRDATPGISFLGERRDDTEQRLARHVRQWHPDPWTAFLRRLGFAA